MLNQHITINMPLCISVQEPSVKLKEVVTLGGCEKQLMDKLGDMVIYDFAEKEERAVLSSVTVISMMEAAVPGLLVDNGGESVTIIKYKPSGKKEGGLSDFLKVSFISLAVFFGSVFTIMTFNSDVDVKAVFDFVYKLTGYQNPGNMVLEISYSIGIFIGIMLFFNHISRKKMTSDPTPIKVQMSAYEQGINQTIIQEAVGNKEVK